MNAPSYPEFERLRLRHFVGGTREIAEVENQAWMGGIWVGEAVGFTGVWCLAEEPHRVGGLEVNFSELDRQEQNQLEHLLRMPLRPGMSLAALCIAFGKPKAAHRFVEDRASYDFSVGAEWPYHLSCTVHHHEGLIHFSLLRENALARCSSE
jgi:hypothetical protein